MKTFQEWLRIEESMSPYLCAALLATGNKLTPEEKAKGEKALTISTVGGQRVISHYIDYIKQYGPIAARQLWIQQNN